MTLITQLIQNTAGISSILLLPTTVICIGVGEEKFVFCEQEEMLGDHYSSAGNGLGRKTSESVRSGLSSSTTLCLALREDCRKPHASTDIRLHEIAPIAEQQISQDIDLGKILICKPSHSTDRCLRG